MIKRIKNDKMLNYCLIPSDLLDVNRVLDRGKDVQKMIKFVSDDKIMIVSNYQVSNIFKIKKHRLELISQSKIDNFHTFLKIQQLSESSQSTMKKVHLKTLYRLAFLGQEYKTFVTHQQNIGLDSEFNLLEHLYRVDYSDDWDHIHSRFGLELSFTLLDWFLVDHAKQDKTFNFKLSGKD